MKNKIEHKKLTIEEKMSLADFAIKHPKKTFNDWLKVTNKDVGKEV